MNAQPEAAASSRMRVWIAGISSTLLKEVLCEVLWALSSDTVSDFSGYWYFLYLTFLYPTEYLFYWERKCNRWSYWLSQFLLAKVLPRGVTDRSRVISDKDGRSSYGFISILRSTRDNGFKTICVCYRVLWAQLPLLFFSRKVTKVADRTFSTESGSSPSVSWPGGCLHQSPAHSLCCILACGILWRAQGFYSLCLPRLQGSGVLKVELGLQSLQKPLKYLVPGIDRTLISYTALGFSVRSSIVVFVFIKCTC